MTAYVETHTFGYMKVRNKEIFEIHAAYCRILASPIRLSILACLKIREMSVSELAEAHEAPMSTISRHLAILRSKNLVETRHEGTRVFYRPSDPRIVEACSLIRTVLIDGMKKRGELVMELKAEELIVDD